MEKDKELQKLIEEMMHYEAPENFEEQLIFKIEELEDKPIPKIEPLISNKVWFAFAAMIGAIFLYDIVTDFSLPYEQLDQLNKLLSKIPIETTAILCIPIVLYFVDVLSKWKFLSKLRLKKL